MTKTPNGYLAPLQGRRLNRLVALVAALLSGMLMLFVFDANQVLFLVLNRVSEYTGTAVWANLTSLGEGLIVLSLTAAVALRWPAAAWAVLIGGIIGTLLVHGLKEAFGLPRPGLVLPAGSFHIIGPRLTVVSFPSGHSATITAFAAIIYLYARSGWARAGLVLLVLLVGLSRVAVGAHWPMDVLAGWLVGLVIALVSYVLAERWTVGLRLPVQLGIVVLALLCSGALLWLEPQMTEARVFRWLIAVVGLGTGAWTLFILQRQSRSNPGRDHPAT
jgi:membrane-associated phospholipid phosphatase